MFSWEFCEIFKNTFSYRTPPVAASDSHTSFCSGSVKPHKQLLVLFCKKGVLRNFANFIGKHLCWSLFLMELQAWRPATLLNRDPTLVFSRGICEIFKNIYFKEHLPTTASEICSFTWTALFYNFWLKLVPML